MEKKARLVVIGNGMAGIRTVEELLKMAPDLYEITVFGDEPHPNYNRILLTPVLAGEMRLEETILNDRSWYAEHGITLRTGSPVVKIDRVRRKVTTAQGETVPYDRILIATGAAAMGMEVMMFFTFWGKAFGLVVGKPAGRVAASAGDKARKYADPGTTEKHARAWR